MSSRFIVRCASLTHPALRVVPTAPAAPTHSRAHRMRACNFASSSSSSSSSSTASSSSSSSSSSSTAKAHHAGLLLGGMGVYFAAKRAVACAPSSSQRRFASTFHKNSRVMLPDDANPAGNVHGGTILNMVDMAGWVAATRYANQQATDKSTPLVAALARIEHMDFKQPMYIGEVSHVEAQVASTTPHSIEVDVKVTAENVITGQKRITNQAKTWYVAVPMEEAKRMAADALERGSKRLQAAPIAHLEYSSAEAEAAAAQRAERQRQERALDEAMPVHPINAQSPTLVHVMLPSDCTTAGTAFAGVILKQMDNAAGITAVRHCNGHVVTASLEAVNFHSPIFNGDIVSFYARTTFTSKRSMEIEVNVYAECLHTSTVRLANTARFTFVSLDKNRRPQDVPQITPETEADKARFAAGLARYKKNKEARAAGKE